MGSVLGLEILMGVPVGVVDDDRVGDLEIQTETAGSGGEDKDEEIGLRVEAFQQLRSIVGFGAAVETKVLVPAEEQKVLHNVHDLRHLEEHQDSVSGLFEFGEDSIEEFEFPRDSPDEVVRDAVRIHRVFDFLENERMIANLLQLHHRVVQSTESLSTKLEPEMGEEYPASLEMMPSAFI